jgi:hypothetical protein
MRFLEVIDLDHDGEPDLARRLRARLLADEPGKVRGFKAANPLIDRGTRHMQKATDADFCPPLVVELDDLKAGLIAIGVAVVGVKGEFALRVLGFAARAF